MPAGQERGHEVRESLARTGPGLHDQDRAFLERGTDGTCHIELFGPWRETRYVPRERAVLTQNRVEIGQRPRSLNVS